MNAIVEWLTKWEALWLFLILALELAVSLYNAWILTIEYFYDKEFNEAMRESRRDRRRKKYEFESLNDGEGK